jgi:hypothetical protein
MSIAHPGFAVTADIGVAVPVNACEIVVAGGSLVVSAAAVVADGRVV